MELLEWVLELRLVSIPGTGTPESNIHTYFIKKYIYTIQDMVTQLGTSGYNVLIQHIFNELVPSDHMKIQYNYQKLLAKLRLSSNKNSNNNNENNNESSVTALNSKIKEWFGI